MSEEPKCTDKLVALVQNRVITNQHVASTSFSLDQLGKEAFFFCISVYRHSI